MSDPIAQTEPALAILPITAVAAVRRGTSELVLIGKGTSLEVCSSHNAQSLCKTQVLKHQAIHGILVLEPDLKTPSHVNLLIHGGSQVVWAVLIVGGPLRKYATATIDIVDTCWLPDWILCSSRGIPKESSATFLTSYNVLCRVELNTQAKRLMQTILCNALSTFLYSADILQTSEDSFLVASGTAFGELLLWLCRHDYRSNQWQAYPWREYHGHGGSIFGVSICCLLPVGDGCRSIVATCSDDRTIRIWDVSSIGSDCYPQSGEDTLNSASFTKHEGCLATTWAHLSRIWNVDLVRSPDETDPQMLLLSTGEDGQAQSWSIDLGKLFQFHHSNDKAIIPKYIDRHHAGKNIWSSGTLRSGGSTTLYTGGGDGQLISRSYDGRGSANSGSAELVQLFKRIMPVQSQDSNGLNSTLRSMVCKSYLVCSSRQILVATDSGFLLKGCLKESDVEWHILIHSSQPKPLVLGSKMAGTHAFFADHADSTLYMIDTATNQVRKLENLGGKKVSNIAVGNSGHSPEVICVAVYYFASRSLDLKWVSSDPSCRATSISMTTLALPDTFEVTSTTFDTKNAIVLCGSRTGAIAVYTGLSVSTGGDLQPALCRRHVHGEDTVTSITPLLDPACGDQTFYLSTGRDGTYCIMRLDTRVAGTLTLLTVHQSTPPLGPHIEGADLVLQQDGSQKVFLHGFRSKHFAVWDETNQTQIMSVDCGGAHRSWNLKLDDTNSGTLGAFVWTKAGSFMYHEQARPDHNIIQSGGHGREIKALAAHHSHNSKWLIASGSEDTDIRLWEYNAHVVDRSSMVNLAVIRKHTTGLQDLQFSPDGSTLISAAGMEELFAWKLSPVPVLGQGVVFAGALPRLDSQSDARIMSIDVRNFGTGTDNDIDELLIAAACSSGKVKLIRYSPSSNQAETCVGRFTVLYEIDLGSICLTQAHLSSSSHRSSTYKAIDFIAGATNGCLTLCSPIADSTPKPNKVHQNSIAAMQTATLTDRMTLIATGGDDNSLGLTLAYQTSEREPSFQTLSIPKAHAAALTALELLELDRSHLTYNDDLGQQPKQKHLRFALVTAGNDQRLMIWNVVVDLELMARHKGQADEFDSLEGLQIELIEERYTNVADVSEMTVLSPPSSIGEARGSSVQVMVVGVGMEVLDVALPVDVR